MRKVRSFVAVQLAHTTVKLANPARFERATVSFVGWCSVQLSYGSMVPLREFESRHTYS